MIDLQSKINQKFSIFLLLSWGFITFGLYLDNIADISKCYAPTYDLSDHIDLGLTFRISVFSTLIFSIFGSIVIYLKKTHHLFFKTVFLIFITNLLSSFILFVTFLIPTSFYMKCSTNLKIILIVSSLFSEIMIAIFFLIFLFIIITFLVLITEIIFEHVIRPFQDRNITRILAIGVFAWGVATFTSFVIYYNNTIVLIFGILQSLFIFGTIFTYMARHNAKNGLYGIILLSIIIFFLEISLNKKGITLYGILSISSLIFYPVYYLVRRVKKIYKLYFRDRHIELYELPREPPAVYASGHIDFGV